MCRRRRTVSRWIARAASRYDTGGDNTIGYDTIRYDTIRYDRPHPGVPSDTPELLHPMQRVVDHRPSMATSNALTGLHDAGRRVPELLCAWGLRHRCPASASTLDGWGLSLIFAQLFCARVGSDDVWSGLEVMSAPADSSSLQSPSPLEGQLPCLRRPNPPSSCLSRGHLLLVGSDGCSALLRLR